MQHKVRVVTPEQAAEGYVEFLGMDGDVFVTKKNHYEVIRKMDDGNYLVKEPYGQHQE